MVRGERRALWGLLAAGFALWSLAGSGLASAEPRDPALAARIFEGLGVRAQIAAIVPSATDELRGVPIASEYDRRLLGRIVARGFAPDRLERASQHAFLAQLDSERELERARIAARWLAEPSVQRLHVALGALSPHACAPGEPSTSRLVLIDAIERAAGHRVRLRSHADSVARNMIEAADALLSGSQQIGRIAVRPPGAASEEDAAVRACRYEGISSAELRSALHFIQGPVGRWLYRSVSRAMDDALGAAARRTARSLIEAFEGRDRAVPARIAQQRGPLRSLRAG